MFPIPWNFPLRKKNGNLVNIGDAIDEGTELPAHGEGDAGKVLSVDENGDLKWSNEVPAYAEADAGKLLSVDDSGELEWSDTVNSEIQTLTNNIDVLVDGGAVNKLPNNAVTQTITGIQVTVNADKSITISGSGNGATFDIFNDASNPIVLTEDCIFSLGATITESAFEFIATATDNTQYTLKLSTGNKITIPAGKSIKRVHWYNNNVFDGTLTIYPMIADADYSGGYVPYAMTNRELTEAVSIVTGTVTPITNTKATLDSTYTVLHKIGHMAILDFVLTVNSADDWTVIGSIDLTPLSIARTIIAAQAGDSDAIKIQLNTSKQIRVAGGTVNKQYEGQLVFFNK